MDTSTFNTSLGRINDFVKALEFRDDLDLDSPRLSYTLYILFKQSSD